VAFAEARRDDGDVVLGVVGVEALEASSTSSSGPDPGRSRRSDSLASETSKSSPRRSTSPSVKGPRASEGAMARVTGS
jgi:hypothetical protein